MRRLIAGVLLGLLAAPALAQPPPALVIEASPDLAAARERLEAFDARPLAIILRLVGLDDPGEPIRVVLAGDESPAARQVSPWTAGFALPDIGLIVLFPSRAPTYPHDTLEDVLRHEVAHVLISRAAGGRPVPRWFHEGLAVAVERPWGMKDRSRLAAELLVGPRLTLDEIDALFDGDQATAARAYSLAAAVVRHLMREHGEGAPAAILSGLTDGQPFDEAMAGVTARSVRLVEEEFWDRQRTWTLWIPLVTSSTVIWLLVTAIAGIARRRRRLRSAEIRRRWAAEEGAAGPDAPQDAGAGGPDDAAAGAADGWAPSSSPPSGPHDERER
ncbi:MAG: hypothetical protein AB1635_08975 [Acidobacteriota bacterium]